VAESINVRVGEVVQITVQSGYLNVSRNYTVASIVEYGSSGTGMDIKMPEIMMDLSEALSLHKAAMGSTAPVSVEIFIWGDRNTLVDPSDAQKTDINLKRTARRIDNAAAPYGLSTQYNSSITGVIGMLALYLTMIRMMFIGLSLPVILLGAYLGVLGADLSHSERRREIGILKSRGASSAHVYSLLMGESLVLGLFAGVVGLLLGVLVSQAMLYTSGQIFGMSMSTPTLFGFSISPLTVSLAMIFGVVLMVVANYRPAKRTSQITLHEALHAFSTEETKIEYKPRNDIIFVVIAVATYLGTIVYTDMLTTGTLFGGFLGGAMIAFCCIGLVLIIAVPLSPFFLIIGVTRLATRSTPKLYEFASHAVKPITKDLWPILKKNISRNPKRASTVCLLISVALSFGLFVSVMFDTETVYQERTVRAQVGGDIQVLTSNPYIGLPTIGNERSIPGAITWAPISFISVAVPDSPYASMALFDASKYRSIGRPEKIAFVDGDPDSAFSDISTGKSVIITQNFANSYAYARGDTITITFSVSGNQRFNIAAVVKYLPGFYGGYAGGGPSISDAVSFFVDTSQVPASDRGVSTVELFDVNDASMSSAAKYLRDTYDGSISVRAYDEELAKIRGDALAGSIYNFLNLEYVFAIAVIGIGLGMIMFMAMIERKQEVANMIARGASIGDIMKLIAGEGITIGLVGIVIGLLTGLSTAYVFNSAIGMLGFQNSIVPRDIILSWSSLWVILATIGIVLLTSVLILIPLKRINLNEILRWRGG
jgi:putative ABC transport system permease protein